MGGFLVSSKDECCCPEMRCCTPETVTATVAGMSGTTTGPNLLWIQSDSNPEYFESDPKNLWPVVFGGYGNTCDSLGSAGFPEPADIIPPERMITETCGTLNYGDSPPGNWDDPVWGTCCFPPRKLIDCNGNTPPFLSWGFQWGGYQFLPFDLCDDFPEMCQRPDGTNWHYGPSTGCNADSRYAIYDEDLNGVYVLHRPDQYLRPALKCRINRSVPLTDSPYSGVTEATLLYNVDPRRTWTFLPPPNECWDVSFPPEADEYCVDYRCGKRNPWYSWNGFGYCVRGKCTVTNQGVVKPHLYYYNELLGIATSPADVQQMQSANLYLRLIPKDYEQDEHGRFPTWWQVGSVDVIDGGYGYQVGQFFQVDFDIRRPWLGGEIMTVFPKFDMSCVPPYYPTWVDQYGYSGTDVTLPNGIPAARLYQRIRISEVDANGAITKLEVVPIFKQPEYSDPPFCNDAKVGDERTKFYVGYGRVLCHPRSVQFPGIGYNVGDQIEFYCDDPPCEVVEDAIAVVTDVDEEGGILDWRIRGSDFPFGYATAYSCDETDGAGNCIASCFDRMPGSEPDQRGKYKWKAKLLCGLTWNGVGNPVRVEVSAAPGAGCRQSLTTLSLTINRVACETSIEAAISQWPFGALIENSSDLGTTRLLYLFPPYPACAGGGAVVRPVFGAWGANESDFGSSLVGAEVKAGGAGYCYREKRHIEPTLPHDVPTLGAGTGARIASFQFSAKHNFPNPAAPYGDTPVAPDRFSYFPVIGATVDPDHRGSGYTVGQEFDVSPVGGKEVSHMWKASGGDTPEQCPDGAWYGGERALLNNDGYRSLLYDVVNGTWGEPVHQEPSVCRLRVSAVTETGGIEELEVVHGGMMFKTEYTIGKKNPLVSVVLTSTLGYGAYIESTFDTSFGSATFGELTGVSVVPPPPGTLDPKHPYRPAQEYPANEWRPAVPISPEFPAQPMPTGGRDYADQSAGYFWMLQNVTVGNGATHTEGNKWSLLAYLPWHCNPWVINPLHPEISTHTVIEGAVPQFVPKSSLCAFGDCYHELLERTYPLVRVWSGSCSYYGWADMAIFAGNAPMTNYGEGRPSTGYLMAVRKGKFVGWEEAFEQSAGDLIAEGYDYTIIEYGPTLSLGYTPSSPCPDHSNGTTTRE